ncbi:MAG TPA: response regulator transcription factor [Woeseiaceae bacterium]|jgi:DNA-binding NarL/FixJ family response regulator|nr:response regulator transcription factor [Woeseiaceae bacterium]
MRFLIIDDEPLFRRGLSLGLQEAFPGATVVESNRISDTTRRHGTTLGHPDAILTEIVFAGNEPLAEFEYLLDYAKDVPVVVISALQSPFYVARALSLGASGYFYKSSSDRALFRGIRQIMESWYGKARANPPPVVRAVAMENGLPERRAERNPERSPERNGVPDWCGVELPERSSFEALTPRQRAVLKHLINGLSNKEIARELDLLEGTVKTHIKSILQKLGANNRTQAVVIAMTLLNAEHVDDLEPPERGPLQTSSCSLD